MTRWVALALRICALWMAWKGYHAICDIFLVNQILDQHAITMSAGLSADFERISRTYLQTPGQISANVYSRIGLVIGCDLVLAVVLWVACLSLARVLTGGIDSEAKSPRS